MFTIRLLFYNKVKNNVPKYDTSFGCIAFLWLGRAGRSCYGTPTSIFNPYPLNLQNKSVQDIRETSITYVVLIEPNKNVLTKKHLNITIRVKKNIKKQSNLPLKLLKKGSSILCSLIIESVIFPQLEEFKFSFYL